MFHLSTEFYNELKQKEQPTNRAKLYEENIGRRHVTAIELNALLTVVPDHLKALVQRSVV
jgi:hypothetical protein